MELMKAVIPHLRLLTLPVIHFEQLSKYLSKSQRVFLADRLMYKDATSAFNVSPSLNLNNKPRSQPKFFSINVKTLTGATVKVNNLKATDTVMDVKIKIYEMKGIPVDNCHRLNFAGRQLEDSKTLSDYNIQQESVIHSILRIRMGSV